MAVHEQETRYRRTVGKRVLTRRAWRDLSQQQLADAAGVTRNFVSAIERGQQTLDAYRLSKLALALGIPVGDLLSNDLEKP